MGNSAETPNPASTGTAGGGFFRLTKQDLRNEQQHGDVHLAKARKVKSEPALQLRPGNEVEVTSGPLRGVRGRVESTHSNKLVIAVDMLGERVTVELVAGSVALLRRDEPPVPTADPAAVQELSIKTEEINHELVAALRKNPSDLYRLHPRKFELLVADLMRDMGYDVTITPESRDGGRDILAVFKTPQGEILTVVECKRYAKERRIGPDILQRLLWVADRKDKASCAMAATTTYFTTGAQSFQREYQWRLKLADFDVLSSWLQRYGQWRRDTHLEIWVPNNEIVS